MDFRWLVALGVFLVPATAAADPYPAVLYIPVDDIDLEPSGFGACSGTPLGAYDPGIGCVPGLDAPETFTPSAEAAAAAVAAQASLNTYDVHVTTERPPPYLPFVMAVTSDADNPEGMSYACVAAPLFCSSRARNGIAFTWASTQNCTTQSVADKVLYGFGRMSGLEGKGPEADHMQFPPDYTVAGKSYLDQCDAISPQLNTDTGVPLPFECTSMDHDGCGSGEVNSHADLIAYYGTRVADTDAPVLSNVTPADGTNFPGRVASVEISVEIEDSDPIVGMQFTIESDVFEDAFDGVLLMCTNPHCDIDFLNGDPFKATDSNWSANFDLPVGTYVMTVEASDFHGNVAIAEMATFTVGGDVGTTGSMESSGEGPADTGFDPSVTSTSSTTGPPPMTTTVPSTSSSGTTSSGTTTTGATDTDDGVGIIDNSGCNCRTAPSPGWALLLPILFSRRRSARLD